MADKKLQRTQYTQGRTFRDYVEDKKKQQEEQKRVEAYNQGVGELNAFIDNAKKFYNDYNGLISGATEYGYKDIGKAYGDILTRADQLVNQANSARRFVSENSENDDYRKLFDDYTKGISDLAVNAEKYYRYLSGATSEADYKNRKYGMKYGGYTLDEINAAMAKLKNGTALPSTANRLTGGTSAFSGKTPGKKMTAQEQEEYDWLKSAYEFSDLTEDQMKDLLDHYKKYENQSVADVSGKTFNDYIDEAAKENLDLPLEQAAEIAAKKWDKDSSTPYAYISQERRARLASRYNAVKTERENQEYKAKIDEYNSLMSNPDFEEKSKFTPIGTTTAPEMYDRINGEISTLGSVSVDPYGNFGFGGDGTLESAYHEAGYDFLTEDEIKIFNYLYATKGRKEAFGYLSDLRLTERRAEYQNKNITELADEAPITASILSSVASVGKAPGYLYALGMNLVGEDVDLYSSAFTANRFQKTVRETVNKKIGNQTGSFFYNSTMSVLDNLVNRAVSGNTEWGTLVLMGLEAASDSVIEAKERGLSDTDALVTATVAGVFETLFEKLSFENLETFKTEAYRGFWNNLWRQMFTEGTEELWTSLANETFDRLYNADLSEFKLKMQAYMASGLSYADARKQAAGEFALQLAQDFGGGVFSAGVMGFGAGAINYGEYQNKRIQNRYNTGAAIAEQGNAGALVNVAREQSALTGTESLRRYAEKVAGVKTDNMSQRQQEAYEYKLGKLAEKTDRNVRSTVDRSSREVVSSMIDKAITDAKIDKGAQKATRAALAQAVDKGMESLSPKQKALVEAVGGKETVSEIANSGKMESIVSVVEARAKLSGLENLTKNKVGDQSYNAEGKTIKISTGEDIELDTSDPIAAVTKEGVAFRLPDGTEISSKDVSLPSYDEARASDLVARIAQNYEISAQTAGVLYNEAVNAITKPGDVGKVMEGITRAYRQGYYNMRNSFDADRAKASGNTISADLASRVYNLANEDYKSRQERVKSAQKTVQRKEGAKLRNGSTENVRVSKDAQKALNDTADKNHAAKTATLEAMERIAEATDIDFRVETDLRNADGKKVNGKFTYENGRATITIDVNAMNDTRSALSFTLAHELTHFIHDWSPAKYDAFARFLMENYEEAGYGENAEAIIRERMDRGMSRALATEELVAEACQKFLVDGNAFEMIGKLAAQDRTLAEKIRDGIKAFADKLRAAFKGSRAQGMESAMTQTLKTLDRLHQMWTEALEDAALNYRAASPETVAKVARGEARYSRNNSFNEGTVKAAIYDALDHADKGDDNLIRVSELPAYVEDKLGIAGDMYVYRNHIYENTVSKERAIKDGRPIKRGKSDIHFHNLGEDKIAAAILSTNSPTMTISTKTPEGNPAVIMILPEFGNNNAPLYAVFSFYSYNPINGALGKHPHVVLTVAERGFSENSGRAGYDEIIRNAIKENRVLDFNKKRESDLSVIAQSAGLGNITRSSLNKNLAQFKKEVNRFREKNNIRYQTAAEDARYLDLAKDPEANRDELQRMVAEAARRAGYDSPTLYHGTRAFGFTAFDLDQLDDRRSIFLTSSPEIASTYSGVSSKTEISENRLSKAEIDQMPLQKIAKRLNEAKNRLADASQRDAVFEYYDIQKSNELLSSVNSRIDKFKSSVDQLIEKYADRMAADFSDEDQKIHSKLVELKGLLDNHSLAKISTPLYMLLNHTNVFEDKSSISNLEKDIRLANKLAMADLSGGVLAVEELGGYIVELMKEADAKEILLAMEQSGNYSLKAKLGKTLTVDGKGAAWNHLKDWMPRVSKEETTVKAEKNNTFLLIDSETGKTLEQTQLRFDIANSLSKDQIHDFLVRKANGMIANQISSTREVSKYAKENGYDSVIFRNIKDSGGLNSDVDADFVGDVYVIFNPENAKSADPVTYDDNGNVIPLSQRFDETKGDIRNQEAAEVRSSSEILSELLPTREKFNKIVQQMDSLEATDEYESFVEELKNRSLNKDELQSAITQYAAWEKSSGYGKLHKQMKSLLDKVTNLQKEYEAARNAEELAGERKAIEASGMTEAEYHRKEAVKEFGYTPYFYDAGYITPNGRMLNFSGEKGKHYGTRGQDHRAIGTIYAGNESTGSEAMLKFMGEGNIRIMAETPGIDISSAVEPTRNQYYTIERFANDSKKRGYFAVDFTDANGNTVGTLEYEDNFGAVRVLNDIRHFYATGEIRQPSDLQRFRYQESIDETESDLDLLDTLTEADASTDEEKTALRSYKDAAARINAVTDELKSVRSKISHLSGEARQDVENLLRRAKNMEIDETAINGVVNKLLENYKGEYSRTEMRALILSAIMVARNVRNGVYRGGIDTLIQRYFAPLATELVYGDRANYSESDPDVAEVRSILRDTRIAVADSIKDQFDAEPEFGKKRKRTEWAAFRKSNMGRVTLVNEGAQNALPVDVAYQTLAEQYPGLFPDDVKNPLDQLMRIAKVAGMESFAEFGMSDEEAQKAITDKMAQILTDTFEILPADPSREAIFAKRRTELADAIKKLATKTDRATLDEYRSRIPNIAALEAELADVNKALRGKDVADRVALRQRAAELSEQIAAEDEKLLDLYATKPLRNVLDQAKAKADAEAKERLAKVREEMKAKAEKQQKEMREHYAESRKEAVQRRNKRVVRNKIYSLAESIGKELANPSKGHYVPEKLYTATYEALTALQLDSKRGEKLAAKLATIQAEYNKLKNTDHAAAHDTVVQTLLENLYKEIGDTPVSEMTFEQLRQTYDTLKAMETVISNERKFIDYEFNKEPIELGHSMIEELESTGKNYGWYLNSQLRPEALFNRFGGYRKNSAWSQLYNMLDAGQRKSLQLMMEFSLPFRDLLADKKNYRSLSKETVDIGLKDRNGNSVKIPRGMMISVYLHLLNDQNARHFMRGGLTVPEIKAYYKNQPGKMWGESKKTVRFSTEISEIADEIRQIYKEHEKEINDIGDLDEAALLATEFGERLAELDKQMEEAIDAEMDRIDALRGQIENTLTEYEWDLIRAVQQFFGELSPAALNEVTEKVYGFSKATVENYFPIITDPNYRKATFDSITGDFRVENAGFMKERIKGAANPMLLLDVVDVVASQIQKTAQYAGMLIPIKNFEKAYGVTLEGYDSSVQAELAEAFPGSKDGKASGKKLVENLLADLQGSRYADGDVIGGAFERLRSGVIGGVLTMNPRVALAQAASLPTAAAEIGWVPIIKAIARVEKESGKHGYFLFSKAEKDLIAKYSPLLWYRMKSGAMEEISEAKSGRGLLARARNSKVGKGVLGWIEMMDAATVGRLWYAAQYYVDDHFSDLKKAYAADRSNQEAKDAYYTEVAKVFEDIVERTQPNYTTMQRPDILRTKTGITRYFTAFFTQRMQNFNILYDAGATWNQYRKDFKAGKNGVTEEDVKGAGKKLTRAVTSQLAAAATITLFKFAVDALTHNMNGYRDDDDELTFWSILKKLALNSFESLASNMLFGSEAFTLIAGIVKSRIEGKIAPYYGIELNGISIVTDVAENFYKVASAQSGESALKSLEKLSFDTCRAFGIPAENAKKLVRGVILQVEDIANGEFGSFEAGVDRTISQDINRMYKSYAEGDTARQTEIFNDLLEKKIEEYQAKDPKLTRKDAEKKAKSTIKTQLSNKFKNQYKAAYNENDTETMNQIRLFMRGTGAYDTLSDVDKKLAEWKQEAREEARE